MGAGDFGWKGRIAAGAALTGRRTARVVTGTKLLRGRFRLAIRPGCEVDRREERTDQQNQQVDLHGSLFARALQPQ